MYKKILDFIKTRPEEYAGSTSKFWDDEHISQYMLDAHLNPDIEAASREHTFIMKSVDWIVEISSPMKSKKLLDLGCGAGIYGELFYDAGFEVMGIDLAKRSIDYAKQHALDTNKQIEYLYQSYLEMDYENQFDVITLIFCDFGVLKPSDRRVLLHKIKKALKSDGILILDAFTANQYINFEEEQTIEHEEAGFWCAVPYACVKSKYRYDQSKNYLEQYIIITNEECNCYNIWNHAFSQESLQDELKCAGFTDFSLFDNVCGESLSNNSNTICVVAK